MARLDVGRPARRGAPRADAAPGRAAFAWEFLRRNPDYRRLARARRLDADAARAWGLRFFADPDDPGGRGVFWRPEVAPAVVAVLEPAAQDDLGALRLDGAARLAREAAEGLHLWFAPGVQALVRGGDASVPLCAVLPLGPDFPLRLKAVLGLQRVLLGAPLPADLTAQQRLRLARALTALDGWRAGASYRQIAEAVFGAAAVADAPWKTASVRDCAIRLVRTGRSLMQGGYLRLLHPAGGPDPA